MVGYNPLSREGSREGCHYSCCGGGRGVGGSRKEVVENQVPRNGGENLGEQWYNLENMSIERRSMCHLERDLDTTLRFEQGGG